MLLPDSPLTAREKRKLRREFRVKGYWAVYHQVSGFPGPKREFAHVWLREREKSLEFHMGWTIPLAIIGTAAALVAAYLIAVQFGWAAGTLIEVLRPRH
jgi:hypothetical protein